MKRVEISDFRNQLSQHLRAVEQGAGIEVTDGRRPIVRLLPVRDSDSQIRIIPARRPFVEVRNRRFPRARWRSDSLHWLFEERGSEHKTRKPHR